MSALRRFGGVLVVFGLALTVLIVRLWEIQGVEHEVWAAEAARQQRRQDVIVARRGTIFDGTGQVVVEDQRSYVLDFVWRDFRREHVLGAACQAVSALLGRPVPLADLDRELPRWAELLVNLSPAELSAFAGGEGLPALAVPPLAEQGVERREAARAWRLRSRSRDARFYIHSLLAVTRSEAYALAQLDREEWNGRPFVERVAAVRRTLRRLPLAEAASEVRGELSLRLAESRSRLERLAVEHLQPALAATGPGLADPYGALLVAFEEARREAEDAVADGLFEAALGFGPWRLADPNLNRLDLAWLSRALVWDAARLAEWRAERGARPLLAGSPELPGLPGGGEAAARVYAAWQLDDEARSLDDRVLDGCTRPFADPRSLAREFEGTGRTWQHGDLTEPFVLSSLRAALDVDAAEPDAPWLGPTPDLPAALPLPQAEQEALRALAARNRDEWGPGDLVPLERALGFLDRRVQAEVAEALDAWGTTSLRADRVDRALETLDHRLRDQSLRPRTLMLEPSWDLIEALARRPSDHAGLQVHLRSVRRWWPGQPERADTERGGGLPRGPLLAPFVGVLRPPSLVRALRARKDTAQASLEERYRRQEVTFDSSLDDAQKQAPLQPEEWVGGTGLEATYDPWLRGRHGFRQSLGLDDLETPRVHIEPQAGFDLSLTLRGDLQEAAEAALSGERGPLDPLSGALDPDADLEWYADPAGALVLMDVEGRVLAAASRSKQAGGDTAGTERTLRIPSFQPPGSTMKPFYAVWALQHGFPDGDGGRLPLRPGDVLERCGWGVAKPSWQRVDCSTRSRHREGVDLGEALRHSCNTYFASIGHRLGASDHLGVLDTFGFAEGSGVREVAGGTPALHGLVEEVAALRGPWERSMRESWNRQSAANGLSVVQLNLVQLARAYAGLATGSLPRATLVERVQQPHSGLAFSQVARPQPLPFQPEHLAIVRGHLGEVVTQGSARDKGLGVEDLGFAFACKTGSADLTEASEGSRKVRKHTWVAGFFPATQPRYVAVLMVHDTLATSSHGAVYVMADFLARPEVRALLR